MLRSLLLVALSTATLTLGCCESGLLAQPPAAPATTPAQPDASVPKPRLGEGVTITVDVTEAPELQAWGDKAKAICEQQYPIICEMLDSEGFRPRESVKIVFKSNMGGTPAATGGDTISVSIPYVLQHPDDFGMMVHELVHVVQRYRRGKPGMGWMTEGIADYIRFHKYEPGADKSRINPQTASYRDSYRTTARFLAYVADTYDKDLVKKLNALMRKGECDETSFKTIVGKDVDDLWKEFIGTLGAGGRSVATRSSGPVVAAKDASTSTGLAFAVRYEGSRPDRPSGVITACWEDGLFVFALNPDRAGENLQFGRISPEQVRRAVDEMWAAGIFDLTFKPGLVPDNATTLLTVRRDGTSVTHQWNEAVSRAWGAHVGADSDYRRFAKTWAVSRAIIAFACPTDYKPIDQQATERLKVAEASNWTAAR